VQKPQKSNLRRSKNSASAHIDRPDALLHHPDRGSQYTSEQFRRLMADHGAVCSMSRSGNVWDNAAMESFFSSLKTERTARKPYRTRDEAKADVSTTSRASTIQNAAFDDRIFEAYGVRRSPD
jgi:transposase InsO family protein